MRKNTYFLLFSLVIAVIYIMPHFILENTVDNYSPLYGSGANDEIRADDTFSYASKIMSYQRTGNYVSDPSVYENRDVKYLMEVSPQFLVSKMMIFFSLDQVYYISVFFSIVISLFFGMFFLNKIISNPFFCMLGVYAAFFLPSIMQWIPFVNKLYVSYSSLLKFYSYTFFIAPLFLAFFFLYLGMKENKKSYMIYSAILLLVPLFSGTYRTLFALESLFLIGIFLFITKPKYKKRLLWQTLFYSIPFLFFGIFVLKYYDKSIVNTFVIRVLAFYGHFNFYNLISLKYIVILVVLLGILYFANKKFLISKWEQMGIFLIMFFVPFINSNVNIITGLTSQPYRNFTVFLEPFLVILVIIILYVFYEKYQKNVVVKAALPILFIVFLSIGLNYHYNYILNREQASAETKELISFFNENDGSVVLSLDPNVLGFTLGFTKNYAYIPMGYSSVSTDENIGMRIGEAFNIYNLDDQNISYFLDKRYIEDLDDDYKRFWAYSVCFANRVSRYYYDEAEAENTIQELKESGRPFGVVRYYKVQKEMYDAIVEQLERPKDLNFKLDYIVVGPYERKFTNFIPNNEHRLVFENSVYQVYSTSIP